MNYIQKNSEEEKELLERFLTYAMTFSTSCTKNADNGIIPSSDCERNFAKMIVEELQSIGFENVVLTKNYYVYAYISPSNGMENEMPFCLLAHMDTVEEVCGKNVFPNVIRNYDGKIIKLKNDVILNPEENKALLLAAKNHETIITTDGTTLLGGDDKAGLAAIITALKFLIDNSKNPLLKHPKIEVLFSPDEETGHGMDKVPLDLISSKFAYTVDGGSIGELEYECFNAVKSDITFFGKASHTGNARENKMVNAISIASSFIASLPKNQMPETTEGYEGFFAPMSIEGTIEKSFVTIFLRDFTSKGIKQKQHLINELTKVTSNIFGGTYKIKHKTQYLNMKEKIDKMPFVIQKLLAAYKASDIVPCIKPIRGGTDGARLTELGIPTPNIFTGAHDYHSCGEWVSLDQMRAATNVLINLASIKTVD